MNLKGDLYGLLKVGEAVGECGLCSSSKREPKPHGPFSLWQGFSALALLTFWTG